MPTGYISKQACVNLTRGPLLARAGFEMRAVRGSHKIK
jgi:hypothetical protein